MTEQRDHPTVALTAQDLRTGAVVYWQGQGWTADITAASVARDGEAQRALDAMATAANAGSAVTDAFVMEVSEEAPRRPRRLRERRRAAGPSAAYGPIAASDGA